MTGQPSPLNPSFLRKQESRLRPAHGEPVEPPARCHCEPVEPPARYHCERSVAIPPFQPSHVSAHPELVQGPSPTCTPPEPRRCPAGNLPTPPAARPVRRVLPATPASPPSVLVVPSNPTADLPHPSSSAPSSSRPPRRRPPMPGRSSTRSRKKPVDPTRHQVSPPALVSLDLLQPIRPSALPSTGWCQQSENRNHADSRHCWG